MIQTADQVSLPEIAMLLHCCSRLSIFLRVNFTMCTRLKFEQMLKKAVCGFDRFPGDEAGSIYETRPRNIE
jgi:hypothetical protein